MLQNQIRRSTFLRGEDIQSQIACSSIFGQGNNNWLWWSLWAGEQSGRTQGQRFEADEEGNDLRLRGEK